MNIWAVKGFASAFAAPELASSLARALACDRGLPQILAPPASASLDMTNWTVH